MPIGQVVAILGSVTVIVAGLVWRVHSIVSPIEANIAALQWQVNQLRTNSGPNSELALRRWVVSFEGGTPADAQEATSTISEVGFKLKDNPDLIAVLIGHTNNEQTMEAAIALGNAWATGLADRLLSQKIDPARILVRSMGFQRPLALPKAPSNARVEIVLVNLRSLLMPGDI